MADPTLRCCHELVKFLLWRERRWWYNLIWRFGWLRCKCGGPYWKQG